MHSITLDGVELRKGDTIQVKSIDELNPNEWIRSSPFSYEQAGTGDRVAVEILGREVEIDELEVPGNPGLLYALYRNAIGWEWSYTIPYSLIKGLAVVRSGCECGAHVVSSTQPHAHYCPKYVEGTRGGAYK